MKQPEDREGIVLRTFDSHGCHGRVGIHSAVDFSSAEETDLLEENLVSVSIENGTDIVPEYSPYEIKTHLLKVK